MCADIFTDTFTYVYFVFYIHLNTYAVILCICMHYITRAYILGQVRVGVFFFFFFLFFIIISYCLLCTFIYPFVCAYCFRLQTLKIVNINNAYESLTRRIHKCMYVYSTKIKQKTEYKKKKKNTYVGFLLYPLWLLIVVIILLFSFSTSLSLSHSL